MISFAIDKFIYLSVNPKFDGKTRVSYSWTENVDDPAQLQHDIVREALSTYNLRGLEITSVSDIPGTGSGLGSSSSFAVGLTHALKVLTAGKAPKTEVMANLAYMLEADFCGHAVGKQDHYAAAYGGLNYMQFNSDGTVDVDPILLTPEDTKSLNERMILFWTGVTRSAQNILSRQATNFERAEKRLIAQGMRDIAIKVEEELVNHRFESLGPLLDENWKLKQQLADGISDVWIDDIYDRAIRAGAEGGKICGAGGGGFMLFIAPKETHAAISKAINMRQVPFRIEPTGSTLIYTGGSNDVTGSTQT